MFQRNMSLSFTEYEIQFYSWFCDLTALKCNSSSVEKTQQARSLKLNSAFLIQ